MKKPIWVKIWSSIERGNYLNRGGENRSNCFLKEKKNFLTKASVAVKKLLNFNETYLIKTEKVNYCLICC